MPLRITTVQTSLVATLGPICSWRTSRWMRTTRVTSLHSCDERTHVITCLNKLLFQVFESSPFVGVTDGDIVYREYGKYVRRTSSLYNSKMSMVTKRWFGSVAASMLAVNHKKDCCSANRGTFLVKIAQLALQMHIWQPKIGCNTPQAIYLLWLCFCPKMASEAFVGARPQTPLVLHVYAWIHTHHTFE